MVAHAPLAANPDLLGQKQPRDLPEGKTARGPYLALLLVGLAVPVQLPVPRWALTPPFHPDLRVISVARSAHRRFVFCGAFPRVTPAGRYPAPLPCGVRTFLEQVALPATIQPSALGAFARCLGARQWGWFVEMWG